MEAEITDRGVEVLDLVVRRRVDPRGHLGVLKVGGPEVRSTSESLGKTR
jgi:hypothetical protein